MGDRSFDLSSVIGLLDALATNTNPLVINPARVAAASGSTRTLGDFTAIWEYLGVPPEPGVTPSNNDSTPPAQALKPRRRHRRRTGLTTPRVVDVLEDDPPIAGPRVLPRRSVRFSPGPNISLAEPLPRPDVLGASGGSEEGEGEGKGEVDRRPMIRSTMTLEERKSSLVRKLIAAFPPQAAMILAPQPNPPSVAMDSDIHVFVDASNIVIGFNELIKKRRGYSRGTHIRQPAFSFHNLSLILERGRASAKRSFVGSSPITPVVLEARAIGYEVCILEKVEKERPSRYSSSSGSETPQKKRLRKVEQGVDEIIHLKILESVLDFPPSTVVLASGDAAVGEYSPGFFRAVGRCLERGWKVELASFKPSLSWVYSKKQFLEEWGEAFTLVLLDDFVEELLG